MQGLRAVNGKTLTYSENSKMKIVRLCAVLSGLLLVPHWSVASAQVSSAPQVEEEGPSSSLVPRIENRELFTKSVKAAAEAIAIARARGLKGDIRLELNTGVFPVNVEASEEGGFAAFQNPNLPTETAAAPSIEKLAAALSLPLDALDQGAGKPRRCGAGVDYIYVKATLDAVKQAKVNSAHWEALEIDQVVGVLLYAEGGEAADASYHARMFAPNAGIPEDPATGSAAAGFPAQIIRSETISDGVHRWVIEQGFEMGRPSRIIATVAVEKGAVQSVRIGGDAVFMQAGQIFV